MKKLDAKWFSKTHKITNSVAEIGRIRKSLILPRKERELFLSNETENPHFKYNTRRLDVRDVRVPVDELKLAIEGSDTHAVVAELYQKKLDRQLIRQNLLESVAAGDDHAFHAASVRIYGAPKKDLFAYVARRVCELADRYERVHPNAARRLHKILSKISEVDPSIEADILPEPIETKKSVSSYQHVFMIFKEVLERLELTDWKLVERPDTMSHFAVMPKSRLILVPKEEVLMERYDMTELHVRALAEHEIGVHVRRRTEARHQPLRLLEIGLDGYLRGEEGLATYVQQQVEGAHEFYGFDRYLAASLAMGMDGQERDFRSVFALMTDYYALRHAEVGIAEPSFKPAWDVCVRIFRGTTGQTAGTIYTKDLVYLEGNIKMWHLLSDKPHVFESLFLGKFNPLLTRHIKSLQTLEILKEW